MIDSVARWSLVAGRDRVVASGEGARGRVWESCAEMFVGMICAGSRKFASGEDLSPLLEKAANQCLAAEVSGPDLPLSPEALDPLSPWHLQHPFRTGHQGLVCSASQTHENVILFFLLQPGATVYVSIVTCTHSRARLPNDLLAQLSSKIARGCRCHFLLLLDPASLRFHLLLHGLSMLVLLPPPVMPCPVEFLPRANPLACGRAPPLLATLARLPQHGRNELRRPQAVVDTR